MEFVSLQNKDVKAGDTFEGRGRLREIVGFHIGKKKLESCPPENSHSLLAVAWARPGRGPNYCSVKAWNRWMEDAKKVK